MNAASRTYGWRRFVIQAVFATCVVFTCYGNLYGEDPVNDTLSPKWTLVIHGGATDASEFPEEKLTNLNAGLNESLIAGRQILADGGLAIDAVEAAVRVLEDNVNFNAGKGAVMTLEGTYELDASMMDGRSGQAGAVAGMRTVRNPISVARAVMTDGRHLLLCADGAEAFAISQGFEVIGQDYFFNEEAFQKIQMRRQNAGLLPLEHPSMRPSNGTVGAVAMDRHGNLAAATSTGGMTGKLPGRIGDSPIIGAGTYAENGVVAVSGTGWGEKYIKHSAAAQVGWFIKHLGLAPQTAVDRVMKEVLPAKAGGMIAVGARGEVVMEFTTGSMNRGFVTQDGAMQTFVLRDNPVPSYQEGQSK